MTESNDKKPNTDTEQPGNGRDPRNGIIIVAVVLILLLVGALAIVLLSDDSGDAGDQPRPEQPIAPTPELKPEQPIAPTPELQPEQPIAPTPEVSGASSAMTVALRSPRQAELGPADWSSSANQ